LGPAAPFIALCAIGLGLAWLWRKAHVGEDDVVAEDGSLIGQAMPVIHPDIHDTTPLSAEINLESQRAKHGPPGV
jgi:hypothetical protein